MGAGTTYRMMIHLNIRQGYSSFVGEEKGAPPNRISIFVNSRFAQIDICP
jgi:hypothetical protein